MNWQFTSGATSSRIARPSSIQAEQYAPFV
jgi:hypothetical protein